MGNCCWELCSNQNYCQKLVHGIQNYLELEDIYKINIVSCSGQNNQKNIAALVESSLILNMLLVVINSHLFYAHWVYNL